MLASDLTDIGNPLAEGRQQIEGSFLAMGERLAESAGMLGSVTDQFEALPQTFDGADVREAMDSLADVARRTQTMSGSFGAQHGDLGRLVEMAMSADRPISELTSRVRTIALVAVNARIAAANISGEQDDFSVFTADIAELANSASATIKEFATVYGRLVERLTAARAERTRFEKAQRTTLRQLASRIHTGLDGVRAERQRTAANSAEIGRIVRQIHDGVGQAVFALQIGDITRQRVEHVEEALARFGEAAGVVQSEEERGVLAATVARLQAAQLDAATGDFMREAEHIRGVLRHLEADAGDLVARGRALYGGRDGRSALAELGDELRAACAVLRDCERAGQDLDRVVAAVGHSLDELLRYVEALDEIETGMRLISLNMTIKCTQLGDRGRALSVIAYELRRLNAETVDLAKASIECLTGAAALARTLDGGASGDAVAKIAVLEDEVVRSVATLENADAGLTDALVALEQKGTGVATALRAAAADTAACDTIAGQFGEALSLLGEWAQGGSQIADTERSALLARHRDILQGAGYTMASERALHAQFLEPAA